MGCLLVVLLRQGRFKSQRGPQVVYRTLELPGKNPLKDAHAALLSAYGFDPQADLLRQLLDLKLEIAARIDRHEPVTTLGLPPTYPNPAALVTNNCIQPPPFTSTLAAPGVPLPGRPRIRRPPQRGKVPGQRRS